MSLFRFILCVFVGPILVLQSLAYGQTEAKVEFSDILDRAGFSHIDVECLDSTYEQTFSNTSMMTFAAIAGEVMLKLQADTKLEPPFEKPYRLLYLRELLDRLPRDWVAQGHEDRLNQEENELIDWSGVDVVRLHAIGNNVIKDLERDLINSCGEDLSYGYLLETYYQLPTSERIHFVARSVVASSALDFASSPIIARCLKVFRSSDKPDFFHPDGARAMYQGELLISSLHGDVDAASGVYVSQTEVLTAEFAMQCRANFSDSDMRGWMKKTHSHEDLFNEMIARSILFQELVTQKQNNRSENAKP